jgi:hypothetical protein
MNPLKPTTRPPQPRTETTPGQFDSGNFPQLRAMRARAKASMQKLYPKYMILFDISNQPSLAIVAGFG